MDKMRISSKYILGKKSMKFLYEPRNAFKLLMYTVGLHKNTKINCRQTSVKGFFFKTLIFYELKCS